MNSICLLPFVALIASVPAHGATVFEFASTNILADESAPAARIIVVRRGPAANAEQVAINTANGSATAGDDYQPTSTHAVFAAGETNVVVEIQLHDDFWPEPDEDFTVHLSALPAGATSGSSVALVRLRDDERPGSLQHLWTSNLGLPPKQPDHRLDALSWIFQPDGKLLVTFRDELLESKGRARLVRLNADGSIDFSILGDPGPFGLGTIFQAFLMPDGKIVLTESATSDNTRFILRRLNPDGTRDTTFTATVRCQIDGFGVVGLPNGKMLLLGCAKSRQDGVSGVANQVNGRNVGDLVRLNQDGSLDATFNAPADLTFLPASWVGFYEPSPVVILPDGKILAGAESSRLIYRLNENGTVDPTFAVGQATVPAELSPAPYVVSLLRTANGQLLVGGAFATFNHDSRPGFLRLNADGTLDQSFPVTGANAFGPFFLTQLQDGRVLGRGRVERNGQTSSNPFLLNTDDTVDFAFRSGDEFEFGASADGKIVLRSDWGIELGRLRFDLPLRIVSITRDIQAANSPTRLTANALADRRYTLQSSETLANWIDLTTQVATTNRLEFIDSPLPPTTSPAQRFYRVKPD